MSGNGKGGNSSTSGSNARKNSPYNTRGKGGTYTSLNNPNDEYSGYETATSKKARRKEEQKVPYKPKNSQTVETSTPGTSATAVSKDKNAMEVDNSSAEQIIDDIQAKLNADLEEARRLNEVENAKKRELELMKDAARDVLGKPTTVTSTATARDNDLNMDDAINTRQNAEASGSGTNNSNTNTPKDPAVITPVSTEVKKDKPRIVITRSQRYRLYAPVDVFTTQDPT